MEREGFSLKNYICLALCALCFLALSNIASGATLYRYQDENGTVSYTDDPSDPRYKYEAVRTDPDSKPESTSPPGEEVKPAVQKKGPAESLSPKDAAEKDRMLRKISELEGVKGSTTNERYLEMIQSEIDLLKKQLKELEPGNK